MKFDIAVVGGGLAGMHAALALQRGGFDTAVISAGRSIHNVDYKEFKDAGGTLLLGDKVERIDGDALYTANLGEETPLRAAYIVLAGGKFFGGGLVSDMDGIREPLAGADVRQGEKMFAERFMDEQPFMRFGVVTDDEGHVTKDGSPVPHIYACGEILCGISAADKDSDRQILDSAQRVAQSIIRHARQREQQV